MENPEENSGSKDVDVSLKGHCHEHLFKNSRLQKHILQQWKPTNTGAVWIKNTMAG